MKRKRKYILFFAAAIVGATIACSITGNADIALDPEEAALVETGVAEVQTIQAVAGNPEAVIATPLFTNAPGDIVQQPATPTPLPEIAQPNTPVPTNPPPPTVTPIAEVWDGTWNTYCYYAPGCDDVILEQTGEHVVGSYRNGDGEIEGTAVGNHLVGVWTAGGDSGTIDFWLNDAGTKWRGNYNGSFFWCGGREGVMLPRPCGVSTWYGTWSMPCIGTDCDMVLTQNGRNVSGTYPNGGTLSGEVTGTHFKGTWDRDGNDGSLDFWIMPGGKSWHGNADLTQGWCGFKDIDNGLVECGINSWYGKWVSQCGGAGCGEINIGQNGKDVTGTYSDGDGKITGVISGDELIGTWTRGAASGDFHFYMSDNGFKFQGNYDGSFPWCGYLEGKNPPAVCYQP